MIKSKINTFVKSISPLFILISFQFSSAQSVKRIDPPFWWKGMKNEHLQLLINFNKELKSIESITCSDKEISKTLNFKLLSNQTYAVLDFDIPANFKSDKIAFTLKSALEKKVKPITFNYELKDKNINLPINGIIPNDFIYLLMPDRFANGDTTNDCSIQMIEKSDRTKLKTRHGGDIQGIINQLDYIEDLGITAIWPTPVLENNQPKESYHGYAITDHYAIDPRFGNLETYRKLKIEAERRKIKLIMDVIYNHIGSNHYLFENKPSEDWFHKWDTFTRTNYKATTLFDPYAAESDKKAFSNGWFDHHMPDLNQQNPELANYLIQNTIWWIENFGLNGLRIDTYTYPDQEFMKKLIKTVLSEYPSMGIFGETWVQGNALQGYFVKNNPCLKDDPILPAVTDFQTYFALSHALTNDFGWTEGLARIYHTLSEDYLYSNPFLNVTFLDNHDLSRFFSIVNEDRDKLKMAIGFMLTTRGTPSLYYGTEILMKNFTNPDALVREDFPGGWPRDTVNKFTPYGRNALESEMYNYIKTIANFRKNSSALTLGKLKQFIPQNGIYIYFRYSEDGEKVMVIMNQDTTERLIKPSRFEEIITVKNTGTDIVSKKSYTFDADILLSPKSIVILEIK